MAPARGVWSCVQKKMKTQAPTETFTTAIVRYADALEAYQEEINGLNVYPVPDGDTGTNLRLTLAATIRGLDGAPDALHQPPGQPPILRKAGVVDAGGRGFLLLLEVLLEELDATPLPPPQVPSRSPAEAVEGVADVWVAPDARGSLAFAFEVQFL